VYFGEASLWLGSKGHLDVLMLRRTEFGIKPGAVICFDLFYLGKSALSFLWYSCTDVPFFWGITNVQPYRAERLKCHEAETNKAEIAYEEFVWLIHNYQ
jgi:hypothetical protein